LNFFLFLVFKNIKISIQLNRTKPFFISLVWFGFTEKIL